MKHIFFAFPAGPAGLALVLVRLSVAISLASTSRSMFAQSPWAASLLALAAASLVIGLQTRAISSVSAISVASAAVAAAELSSPSAALCLQATALALIGPGAYSVDSALFGRRTVQLPD